MTQPRRPHCQPSHNAGSPRWTRRKWGSPHSGQEHHHQQGNLAGEWTSQQYSMPSHRAWRHTEAARHRPLANLVRNLTNQCRTPGERQASTDHQPMGHNPQVARAPPPWRLRRITPTQARRGRRCHEAHLKPARSQRPGKTHPTRPSTAGRETLPSGHNRNEDSFDAFMESAGGTTRPPGGTTQPGRGQTPRGVTPGTPPAQLHRPGAH